MPVLYYKANTTNLFHIPSLLPQDLARNIYNSLDNQMLIDLGLPWDPFHTHPLATTGGLPTPDEEPTEPRKFYDQTRNPDFDALNGRPYKADSFILMSAGFDGLYGTKDDVFDFEK